MKNLRETVKSKEIEKVAPTLVPRKKIVCEKDGPERPIFFRKIPKGSKTGKLNLGAPPLGPWFFLPRKKLSGKRTEQPPNQKRLCLTTNCLPKVKSFPSLAQDKTWVVNSFPEFPLWLGGESGAFLVHEFKGVDRKKKNPRRTLE